MSLIFLFWLCITAKLLRGSHKYLRLPLLHHQTVPITSSLSNMPRKRKGADAGRRVAVPPTETVEEIKKRMIEKGIPADTFPETSNFVATVNMDCMIDLNHLAKHARNVEYCPKRFPAAIIRIRQPRGTALIFKNGAMTITGFRTEADSRLAVKKFVRLVQKLGYAPNASGYKIVNIVARSTASFKIRLEGFVRRHHNFCNWEPEIFVGCVYDMALPRLKPIIFTNGKVVFTGAKYVEHLYQAWEQLYPALVGESIRSPEHLNP
jgi:transcription initiation factor TFIID TATA-box-binding protein